MRYVFSGSAIGSDVLANTVTNENTRLYCLAMFEAIVFVVSLYTGAGAIKDTRGPYSTERECRERTEEMRDFILVTVPSVAETILHCSVIVKEQDQESF